MQKDTAGQGAERLLITCQFHCPCRKFWEVGLQCPQKLSSLLWQANPRRGKRSTACVSWLTTGLSARKTCSREGEVAEALQVAVLIVCQEADVAFSLGPVRVGGQIDLEVSVGRICGPAVSAPAHEADARDDCFCNVAAGKGRHADVPCDAQIADPAAA